MPLGPFDRRNRRRRCLGCSKSHVKCSGEQPCGPCHRRGQVCHYADDASSKPIAIILDKGKHKTTTSFALENKMRVLKFETAPVLVRPTSDTTLRHLHFFGSFVETNRFAAGVTVADVGADLRSMLRSNVDGQYLLDAALAIGALWEQRQMEPSSGKHSNASALKSYSRSVTSLRCHMESRASQVGSTTDVMWTTLFLGLFELMYNTSGDGWLCHFVHGTSKALVATGPSAFQSDQGLRFFLQARTFEICRSIIFNEATFLHGPGWVDLSRNLEGTASDAHHRLLDIVALCSTLRVSTGSFIDSLESSISSTCGNDVAMKAGELALEGFRLRFALQAWESQFVIDNNKDHPDDGDISLLSRIFLAATSIYLSGNFDYDTPHWKTLGVPTPTLASEETEAYTAEILHHSDLALRTTDISGILLLFPVRVAGARAIHHWQRQCVRTLLLMIGQRFAVAKPFLEELDELWEWRDEQRQLS